MIQESVQELVAVLSGAKPDQLEFDSQPLKEHHESPDERVGHQLVGIAGHAVPESVRLAYVVGRSPTAVYVYVVMWPSVDSAEPVIYDVGSEAEARSELLKQLRETLKPMLGGQQSM